jgi:methylglyoxal synthase
MKTAKQTQAKEVKNIALVAHDNCKADLVEWVKWNSKLLVQHKLICTGTTGKRIEKSLNEHITSKKPNIKKLKSGPLGGDLQLGALIAEGKIDILIFFWDPMQPQPHDVDVKALLRIAVVYNLPFANNRATADFIIASPLFHNDYVPRQNNYSTYLNREASGTPTS